jgi:hypothetical protein
MGTNCTQIYTNLPSLQENFFARENVLGLLEKRLQNLKDGYRQNLAILSKELLGKTSVLYHFLKSLKVEEVIPFYLEAKLEPFSSFARRFMGSLLYSLLRVESPELPESLEILIQRGQKVIPETAGAVQKIKESLDKERASELYPRILGLIELISNETGKPCLVILEEFHRLANLKVKAPFVELGKKIMLQKNVMYIVTSSSLRWARKILSQELSLLFGNFEVIELDTFDLRTSQRFLNSRLAELNIPKEATDFIATFSGGHPFYLDVLCNQILKESALSNRKGDIQELLVQTIALLLFNRQGVLNQHFTNFVGRIANGRSSHLVPTLLALTQHSRIRDIAKSLKKPTKDVSKQINRLSELDIVSRFGSFYRLTDKVFDFWLKSVYSRNENAFSFDIERRLQELSRDIREMASRFASESRRNLKEKILELFKSFDKRDIVEIRQKNYRLATFKELTTKRIKDREYLIASSCPGPVWICSLLEDEASEDDVADFISDIKKFNLKFDRKIIICLGGIKLNATLLAKEAKIWTWGLNDINLLFELYGKVPIVR